MDPEKIRSLWADLAEMYSDSTTSNFAEQWFNLGYEAARKDFRYEDKRWWRILVTVWVAALSLLMLVLAHQILN